MNDGDPDRILHEVKLCAQSRQSDGRATFNLWRPDRADRATALVGWPLRSDDQRRAGVLEEGYGYAHDERGDDRGGAAAAAGGGTALMNFDEQNRQHRIFHHPMEARLEPGQDSGFKNISSSQRPILHIAFLEA